MYNRGSEDGARRWSVIFEPWFGVLMFVSVILSRGIVKRFFYDGQDYRVL